MNSSEFHPKDSEIIALRHAARVGYRLAAFREAAIPIYRLRVRTLVVTETPLSTTQIFVLRAIDQGLGESSDITGMLGLDGRVVQATLSELLRNDEIALTAPPGTKHQRLALTVKGRRTLSTQASEHPEEKILTFYWDGMARKIVSLSDVGLMTPQSARAEEFLKIPTIAGNPPQADDLDRAEVERMLDKATGRFKRLVSILSFAAIESRYVLYQPAVALIFVGRTPSDVQVGFAIDGHLSDEHEAAFAKADGVSRMKIAKNLLASTESIALPESIAAEAKQALSQEQADDEGISDTLLAKAETEEVEQAVADADSEQERKRAMQRLTSLRERIQVQESSMFQPTIRRLSMAQHAPLLRTAMADAKRTLLIISPWIRAKVVNHRFVRDLGDVLKRGVRVYIGWGIGDHKEKEEMSDFDMRAVHDLEALSKSQRNFTFHYLGNSHSKILIQDEILAVYTSFNWLSFKGDPTAGFREENGLLITIPEKVREFLAAELLKFPK